MGIIKQDIYVCNAYLELVMTQLVQRSHHVTECKSNNVISCSLVVVSSICYNLIKPHEPIINVYMKISSMASKQTYYFFHCMEVWWWKQEVDIRENMSKKNKLEISDSSMFVTKSLHLVTIWDESTFLKERKFILHMCQVAHILRGLIFSFHRHKTYQDGIPVPHPDHTRPLACQIPN